MISVLNWKLLASRTVSPRRTKSQVSPRFGYKSFTSNYLRECILVGRKGTNLLPLPVGRFSSVFGGFCGELGPYHRVSRRQPPSGFGAESSLAPGNCRWAYSDYSPFCCDLLFPANRRCGFSTGLSLPGSRRNASMLLLRCERPSAVPRHP